MAPHSSTLAWKSHGLRSPAGCSPWGRWESDTAKRLHFHFSFSCIGEGNGNPLQCSCLENPRDGGSLVGCRLWGHTELDTTEVTQQQQQPILSPFPENCFPWKRNSSPWLTEMSSRYPEPISRSRASEARVRDWLRNIMQHSNSQPRARHMPLAS